MTPILQIFQNIIPQQDKLKAKLPRMARFGIVALLLVLTFVMFIFYAQFLLRYMIVLLPIFYIAAVLSVGAKKALYGTAVFMFFCFALWIRIGPSYDAILGGPVVQFQSNDADYHVRLIENFVHNFPHRMAYEPYTLYPTGQDVQFAPFFDFVIALFIWIAGLGHPDTLLIERMVAYYPAILGALTVIPAYFIGREVFNNRNAGLIAAGLLAILPGEFLARSTLGHSDHHIIETLLTTMTMMFLILAIRRAQELPPTFSNFKNKEWTNLKKPLIFSTLAGLTFGFFLLSWNGGALFIFVIFVYFVVQYVLDHLKGKSTDYLCIIGLPVFLLPLILNAPFLNLILNGTVNIIVSVGSAIAIAALSPLSLMMNRLKIKRLKLKRILYPITIIAIALVLVGLFKLISPYYYANIMQKFSLLIPSPGTLTIMEAQPFLGDFHRATFLQDRVWHYFTTGTFLAAIAFLAIAYPAVKTNRLAKWSFFSGIGIFLLTGIIWIFSFSASIYCRPINITFLIEAFIIIGIYCLCEKNPARTLLIIWSFIILISLLGQTRFAYYFAVNIALLSCYVLWKIPSVIYKIFQIIGWKEALTQDSNTKAAKKTRTKELEKQSAFNFSKPKYLSGFLSIIVIFFLTVYPNLIYGTVDHKAFSPKYSVTYFRASNPLITEADWYNSMIWMKNNTPDPFGNDDFFYSLYEKPTNGSYPYPSTAYGVMSWWDYGHWITLFAHRIPNANPFQSGVGGPGPNGTIIPGACTFMTAQDEAAGNAVLDALGSKYVVIDYKTAGIEPRNSIFSVMPIWAGQDPNDYYEVWYQQTSDGGISNFLVFYPEYYKSMCVRLYTFGAEATNPISSTWALSYREISDDNGNKFKLLTGVANNGSAFATYEEAAKFVQDHPSYIIVGVSPLQSPIPLEELTDYKQIYSSDTVVAQVGSRNISWVEIFEYNIDNSPNFK